MPEITDAGMYKEWWANPAVVGLMVSARPQWRQACITWAIGMPGRPWHWLSPSGARRSSLRELSTFEKEASSVAPLS